MPYLLRCQIQPYAWGSPHLLAEFTGRVPSGSPEAELWVGAHPALPSEVSVDGRWSTLDALIQSEPVRFLGAECVRRFGPSLPMLVKVLGVDAPLSLQAHPSEDLAKLGAAREDDAGLLRGDPARSYADAGAKPELVLALSPFLALGGFLPPADAADALVAMGGPLVRAWGDAVRSRPASEMGRTVGELLTLPREQQGDLVAEVSQHAGGGDALLAELAERYPHDAGVVVAAMLRRHELAPGDAMFVPAGVLHSYVRGLAAEVQASSDNVLRGGLTAKRVDVPELLRVLEPSAQTVRIVPRRRLDTVELPVPCNVFCASVHLLGASSGASGAGYAALESGAPALLLCLEGRAEVASSCGKVLLERGDAAFVPACASDVQVRGDGRLLRAAPPINP